MDWHYHWNWCYWQWDNSVTVTSFSFTDQSNVTNITLSVIPDARDGMLYCPLFTRQWTGFSRYFTMISNSAYFKALYKMKKKKNRIFFLIHCKSDRIDMVPMLQLKLPAMRKCCHHVNFSFTDKLVYTIDIYDTTSVIPETGEGMLNIPLFSLVIIGTEPHKQVSELSFHASLRWLIICNIFRHCIIIQRN